MGMMESDPIRENMDRFLMSQGMKDDPSQNSTKW